MTALMMRGRSLDCGNKPGYAQASFALALQDMAISREFSDFAFALLARKSGGKGHRLAILREVA
jgi:UTP-glucose-1-phosphate uridylyltransferase